MAVDVVVDVVVVVVVVVVVLVALSARKPPREATGPGGGSCRSMNTGSVTAHVGTGVGTGAMGKGGDAKATGPPSAKTGSVAAGGAVVVVLGCHLSAERSAFRRRT